MPDFYSGATDQLGRFIEGFLLRRLHFERLLAWLALLCAFVLAATAAAPRRSDQPSGAA